MMMKQQFMVYLNMYRETISPLESSFAYKMKTDAIKLLGETTLDPQDLSCLLLSQNNDNQNKTNFI